VEVLKRFPIKILIVSFSNVSGLRLQKLQDVCEKFDVELKIIASEKILIGKEFSSLDIRSPSIAELIGKSEIKIDYKSASEFISGKRVLITGAGGSIGYELSKQISEFNPALLILLDRDESSLLRVNVDLTKSSLVTPNVILADIRDFDRIQKIVSSFKPDIIFHTAALKHVQMLENFPDEALKTNVLATHNLLLAADENNVKVFVNISTDKAADPISVLGISKLASERLTAGFAINSQNAGSRYMSVRFGNVFGSRGSVLETFTKQITLNGPITVTDPKVKRFFMTAQEAIHLVIRAAVFGTNGHTIVLRMDNQLYVRDIAEKLIKKSGKQIDIIYTGLRVGEKITEKLVGTNEIQLATIDKDLFSVAVKPWWLSQNSSSWDEFISKFPFNH
jgi:FlaA1/EpsC-like NDP-sugar epimerase